jgi:hypothetical protein
MPFCTKTHDIIFSIRNKKYLIYRETGNYSNDETHAVGNEAGHGGRKHCHGENVQVVGLTRHPVDD